MPSDERILKDGSPSIQSIFLGVDLYARRKYLRLFIYYVSWHGLFFWLIIRYRRQKRAALEEWKECIEKELINLNASNIDWFILYGFVRILGVDLNQHYWGFPKKANPMEKGKSGWSRKPLRGNVPVHPIGRQAACSPENEHDDPTTPPFYAPATGRGYLPLPKRKADHFGSKQTPGIHTTSWVRWIR